MKKKRDAAAVRFFPPGMPLLTILIGIGMNRLIPFHAGIPMPTPLRYWVGGIIAVAALLGLGAWSVILLHKDGQSANPWKPTFRIIEKGPFRITRNPMYLQMVVVCLGVAIATMNGWIFVLTPVCAWLLYKLAIQPEETYLTEKFGDEYLEYKRRTRRWL
jgi:protein-S-isoprenylcysteine O-methyltransferase Ste14